MALWLEILTKSFTRNPDAIKETIARGFNNSIIAYVGKTGSGQYNPFLFGGGLNPNDVEISDDVFVITKDTAEEYTKSKESKAPADSEPTANRLGLKESGEEFKPSPKPESRTTTSGNTNKISWIGEVAPQKWMNFYTKVLSKFTASGGLKITLKVDISPEEGVSYQKIEETKVALRELGLKDDLELE